MLFTSLPNREQQLTRRFINRLLHDIHELAHRVVSLGVKISEAVTALSQLETANAQFVQAGATSVSGHLLLLISFVAAYLIDYLLFSPSVEFLVGGVSQDSGWTNSFAKVATPAAILLLEAGIAFRRFRAEEEAESYGNRGPFWFWTALGLVPAIIAPLFAVATQLVKAEVAGQQMTLPFKLLLAGLGALAALIHTFVLLSGRYLHIAKAYVVFKIQRSITRNRVARPTRERNRVWDRLNNTFTDYLHRLNAYNAAYPNERIEPGPFDISVRQEINGMFGYEIIQNPEPSVRTEVSSANSSCPPANDANNQPTPAQSSSEPPRSSGNDGMQDYYRSLLMRQVRDQEAEVSKE